MSDISQTFTVTSTKATSPPVPKNEIPNSIDSATYQPVKASTVVLG